MNERLLDYIKELERRMLDSGEELPSMREDINLSKEFIEPPLLNIRLADIDSVPVVYYNGEEINMKIRVSFDYNTETDSFSSSTFVRIEHADPDSDRGNIKVIQHNHPIYE